jgi:hypothetical protein
MRLWLDDIRPAPDGWEHAKTLAEACALVIAARARGVEWTDASLDHDLGFCDECALKCAHFCPHFGTGTVFVDWMAQQQSWPTNKPTLHTMNPVGRKRMQQTIDRYGPY